LYLLIRGDKLIYGQNQNLQNFRIFRMGWGLFCSFLNSANSDSD